MKSVSLVLCAFAAAQLPGVVLAATPAATILMIPAAQVLSGEAELTNPAAQATRSESVLFRSVVAETSAETAPPAVDAGGGCDAGCDCGSGCCCGDGIAGCCGASIGACGAPLWTASVGGVVLSRSQPVPAILADPIVGATGIRATDFSIGTTVGVDLTIARRITEAGSLEARYLGALEWDPHAEFTGLSDLNLGGIDLPGITGIGGGYNSTLHSSEFNWRQQRSERFSWLVGFRWIELEDTVDFFVTTNITALSLDWNTNNHLYGGQIGGDYLFWQSAARPLSVKGSAKGGVYGNDADNDFSQFIGPVQIASGGGFGSEVAFVTDLTLTASYQLTERWSARGGFQFLYIDGVALGSDQVAASLVQDDPNAFDSSGYVYYTGGTLSLDYVW